MPRRSRRLLALAGALSTAVALGACAPSQAGPPITLRDLPGAGPLRARFDADRGQPRLLLLLSPT